MTREDKNTTKCYCGHTTYCDCDPLVSKQTAVEWLIDQVEDYIGLIPTDIINQAKAMEKEQIEKAWDDGDYAYFHSKETGRDFDNGEQYYNETYKK